MIINITARHSNVGASYDIYCRIFHYDYTVKIFIESKTIRNEYEQGFA